MKEAQWIAVSSPTLQVACPESQQQRLSLSKEGTE
jgi:hypothetical protein